MAAPDFNLAAHVLARAPEQPDKIALAVLGPARAERWSYGKLEAAVRGVGHGLLEAGLRPGDQLLLRLGNGVAFPLAFLGAIAVGIVPIPTSAQLTRPEIDSLLAHISPAALVCGPGLALPSEAHPTITEAALLAMAKGPPAQFARGSAERLAYIMFTSGTSGRPRAVAHAHRAILARAMMFEGWYGLTSEDRLLHAGALNWTFTLGTGLLDPWTMGATALVPAEGTALTALPLLLKRHDATLFAAAPGVLRKLLKAPEKLVLPRLRHTLTAGDHLQPALRDAWQAATGKGLYDAYGMTECSTFLSASPAGAPSLTVQPGRRVKIMEDGTIAIHRAEQGLMLGYVEAGRAGETHAPGLTQNPTEGLSLYLPLQNDHFLTSDRARQDADGTIHYEGRTGEMMNAGGYRVSPLEVEAALGSLAGIEDVAVAEVPVKDTSIIVAFHTGPAPISPATWQGHLDASLAGYKHPRALVHLPALPRSANGKLIRRALPQLFEAAPDD
ncbi:MAG: class I adenylate-forming enzyme family protein [Pseudomonadota bacterium]